MKSGFTDSHIRKYLLGAITQEDELASIEKRMLSDRTFLSEVERAEAELIEEYFDEKLTPGEKRNFEVNFLAAPQRKAKFRFMLALVEKAREYAGGAKARKPRGVFLNDWFAAGLPRLAACAVLILVLGLGFWWFLSANKAGNKVNEGLAALNTAYLKQRTTEVRLSALDHAPQHITRGGEPSEVNSLALDKAGLLLVAGVEERPDAESHRALGLYYVSRREMDKALDQFDKGLAYKPADARFYADYGAVLLETVKSGQKVSAEERSRRLDNSLAQLDKALKIDGDYLPALFNKALCLQEMNTLAAAREIWKIYLEKDPSSKWSKEAQDNLNALDKKNTGAKNPEKVLGDFMQAYDQGDEAQAWKIASESKEMITGTMVSEQLTRGLLSADAQGAPENADRMLSALIFLGRLEKDNAGDVFFYDLAEYYRRAGPGQRAKSNQALLLTREGYAFCLQAKYKAALAKFLQGRDLFIKARNPQEAARTDYWISYSNVEGNLNESVRLSGSLVDYSRGKSYRWLLGQALTLSSSNYIRQSKFSPAVLNANEALKIARETSDAYNQQKTSAQLADIYTQLNEPARALENSQNSLRENGTYFNSPRQTWRNYVFATQLFFAFRPR